MLTSDFFMVYNDVYISLTYIYLLLIHRIITISIVIYMFRVCILVLYYCYFYCLYRYMFVYVVLYDMITIAHLTYPIYTFIMYYSSYTDINN